MDYYKPIITLVGVGGLITIFLGWLTYNSFGGTYIPIIVGFSILIFSLISCLIINYYTSNQIFPQIEEIEQV